MRSGRTSDPSWREPAPLVDDGLATGASVRAAAAALWQREPAHVVVAVPTGSDAACAEMQDVLDEVVSAEMPAAFRGVGGLYCDCSQSTDEEVAALLRAAA